MAETTPDVFVYCIDYLGRPVYLTQNTTNHIQKRHPEITPFLDKICDALAAPNFVYHRPRVSSFLFYRLGVLTGKLSNTYMVVIVRYNEVGDGDIKTVYATTHPASDDTLIHIGSGRGP